MWKHWSYTGVSPSGVIKWVFSPIHIHTNIWGRLKLPYAITRLTTHFVCGLMSDLVIHKFRKRIVLYDTECPYWDQVSLNKQNKAKPVKRSKWLFTTTRLTFHLGAFCVWYNTLICNPSSGQCRSWCQMSLLMLRPCVIKQCWKLNPTQLPIINTLMICLLQWEKALLWWTRFVAVCSQPLRAFPGDSLVATMALHWNWLQAYLFNTSVCQDNNRYSEAL